MILASFGRLYIVGKRGITILKCAILAGLSLAALARKTAEPGGWGKRGRGRRWYSEPGVREEEMGGG